MLSYRLGTVNDFHWGFKPVLSYSKPYTFSTFFGEDKENMHLISPTRPLRRWSPKCCGGCICGQLKSVYHNSKFLAFPLVKTMANGCPIFYLIGSATKYMGFVKFKMLSYIIKKLTVIDDVFTQSMIFSG